MGYLVPAEAPVSCDWQCHKDRDPPSGEPGTDIACNYGTPLEAADPGTVSDVKHSNSDATGRFVTIRLDDGRTIRYLHLAEAWVSIGQRVTRGQVFGLSGGSGFGSDHGYGSHVHVTLWPGQIWAAPTIDFELYLEEPEPEPARTMGDEDMRTILFKDTGSVYTFGPQQVKAETNNYAAGVVRNITGSTIGTATGYHECGSVEISALCESFGVPWSAVERATRGDAFNIDGTPGGYFWSAQMEDAHTSTTTGKHPLSTPAWVGGFILGLIGLVEVIRLFVDVLV